MLAFAKFLLVGVTNTFLGLGVIYLAWSVFGLSDVISNMIGYAVGILWGFFLNSKWTFDSGRPVAHGLLRYGVVCGLAYLGNLGTLIIAGKFTEGRSFLPQFAGMATYTLLSYFGCKYYAFSKVGRG